MGLCFGSLIPQVQQICKQKTACKKTGKTPVSQLITSFRTWTPVWFQALSSYPSSPAPSSLWQSELGPHVRPFFFWPLFSSSSPSSFGRTEFRPHVLLLSAGVTKQVGKMVGKWEKTDKQVGPKTTQRTQARRIVAEVSIWGSFT